MKGGDIGQSPLYMNKLLIVVLLAIIIVGSLYLTSGLKPLKTGQLLEAEKEEIQPPAATGKVDDTISSMLDELQAELNALEAEELGVEVFVQDEKDLSDFARVINESEF